MLIEKPKLFHVTTIYGTMRLFLMGHIRYLQKKGFEVHGVCSPEDLDNKIPSEFPISIHPVSMARAITPLKDLETIREFLRLFRKHKPQIINAHTPKAGVLGMMAAFLAGVPIRIYTCHGLALTSQRGWRRQLLKTTELISCLLAHQVLCVSESLRQELISEGLCPGHKSRVVEHGSISGVDPLVFSRTPEVMVRTEKIREELGIKSSQRILGYVGRLSGDKGIVELAKAWNYLKEEYPELLLLIVGDFEKGDAIPAEIRQELENSDRVILVGWQWDVAAYMALMDLLVLPSYREGFGLTLIEAAAMEVPTVATRISGCVDAIEDGVTGVLVEPRSIESLLEGLRLMLSDRERCKKMGQAGRARALDLFSPQKLWEGHRQIYRELLGI